jgi:hypothetical protein
MEYKVEALAGYIKAEMRERDSAEETRAFVDAILAAMKASGLPRVLISIRDSRAIFKVEDWKFSAALEEAMRMGGLKVAFISNVAEVALSQQYIALLGRQRGLAFQAFGAEAEAVAWLLEGEAPAGAR